MKNWYKNYRAIDQFIAYRKLKAKNERFAATVTVDTTVNQECVEFDAMCSFQYDPYIPERRASIEWAASAEVIRQFQLIPCYGTAYYSFEFNGDSLTISGDNCLLVIR